MWLVSSVTSYGQLQADDAVQGQGASGSDFVSAGALHLPGADGRRHPALPDRRRSGRRRPAPAPRADARRRRAVQRALRRDVRRSRGPTFPSVGARIMDLQEPTKKMSTTGGTPQGTVLVLDPPDVIARRSSPRSPTPGARCGTTRDGQAGRLEPDRDHVGRDRRVDRRDRGALRRAAATAQFKDGRRRGRRRAARSDPAALRGATERRGASSRRLLARRRRQGTRRRLEPTLEPDVRARWASSVRG